MHGKAVVAGIGTLVAGVALGMFLTPSEERPQVASTWQGVASTDSLVVASRAVGVELRGPVAPVAQGGQALAPQAPDDSRGGAPRAFSDDELYEALARIEIGELELAEEELDVTLAASFRAHDDWDLQELAFAIEREADPETHRQHVLAVAHSPESPVGALVGAISSAEGLDGPTQRELLLATAQKQCDMLGRGVEGLEAIQRLDIASGAAAYLVRGLSPAERADWLLEARGVERRLVAESLSREDLLVGPQGLAGSDARRLVEALVGEGLEREDLIDWGPELQLVANMPAEALLSPGLNELLARARQCSDGEVQAIALDLLALREEAGSERAHAAPSE